MTDVPTRKLAPVIRVGLVLAVGVGFIVWRQFTGPDSSQPAFVAPQTPALNDVPASVLADDLITFGSGVPVVASINADGRQVRVRTTLRSAQGAPAADLAGRVRAGGLRSGGATPGT